MSEKLEFLDYDARREPKTSIYCCKCQQDLNPDKPYRWVYLTGDMETVHPQNILSRAPKESDFGWLRIGLDCARIHGIEWTTKEPLIATQK